MATEHLRSSHRALSFPFRIEASGGAQSARTDHIREQIAQLLLTGPGERVFLPGFGLGLSRLMFLPMTPELWSRITTALAAGVSDILKGEASPGSIEVHAGPHPTAEERLDIVVRYRLAALNRDEEIQFTVQNGVLSPPGSSVGAGGG